MIGSRSGVTIIETSDDLAIGTWADFMFTIFRRSSEVDVVTRSATELRKFAMTRKSGVGMITIIKQKASFPSQKARRVLTDSIAKVNVLASATIMEGQGFRAAAVRGAVTGISMVISPAYPTKIFSRPGEACAWISAEVMKAQSDLSITPIQLENALEEFVKKV